jgi:hypothetical protein
LPMTKDQTYGGLILVVSGIVAFFYVLALFFPGARDWAIGAPVVIAVLAILGITGWIGYTMYSTPPPAPLESEMGPPGSPATPNSPSDSSKMEEKH